jgi:3-hydroxy acid dehydrogenase / malonic semialdehyde reductase
MIPMTNRIVVVTGASAGIGYACAETFAVAGAKLILTARRKDRIEALASKLKREFGTATLTMQLDVRDQRAVEKAFSTLPESWQAIDVLVNNAGLSRGLDKLHEGKILDWEEMIDTNIKGLLYVSRAILPGMVKRASGTVVNIGSIAGHDVYPGGNVYCATKHAVDAITRSLRMDLVDTPIRVCTVDPGLVETEFSLVRFRGDAAKAVKVYENLQALKPTDVAEAVLFCATRPAHVQVAELIVLPTVQASPTIVYRKGK